MVLATKAQIFIIKSVKQPLDREVEKSCLAWYHPCAYVGLKRQRSFNISDCGVLEFGKCEAGCHLDM